MKFEISEVIRKNLVAQRKSLAPATVADLSTVTIKRFLELFPLPFPALPKALNEPLREPLRVALYRALPSEFNLSRLEAELLKQGALLHYPRIVTTGEGKEEGKGGGTSERKEIEFVHITGSELAANPWELGSFGIQEPPSARVSVLPEDLDLIFLPGVAFGESGERIGMGAGYYDRFLLRAPQALRVALAFDFQVLPRLEQKSWDQPVHWVVTEKRSFQTVFAQEWLKNRYKVRPLP